MRSQPSASRSSGRAFSESGLPIPDGLVTDHPLGRLARLVPERHIPEMECTFIAPGMGWVVSEPFPMVPTLLAH